MFYRQIEVGITCTLKLTVNILILTLNRKLLASKMSKCQFYTLIGSGNNIQVNFCLGFAIFCCIVQVWIN